MVEKYTIRTDLAMEQKERFESDHVEVSGVVLEEEYDEEREIKITTVRIETENGAKMMGKPVGTYLTLEVPDMASADDGYHREISETLAGFLEKYVENEEDLVYYTIKVYRESGGLLVTSHSNSAFSKDMQYEVKTDAVITEENVAVQWQTLSGETTDSRKNQFGLAVVTVSAEGAVIDQRVISFVGGAVERITDAVNP